MSKKRQPETANPLLSITGAFPRWLIHCSYLVPLGTIALVLLVTYGIRSRVKVSERGVLDAGGAGEKSVKPGTGSFFFPEEKLPAGSAVVALSGSIDIPGKPALKIPFILVSTANEHRGMRLNYSMAKSDSAKIAMLMQTHKNLAIDMQAELPETNLLSRITGKKKQTGRQP